MNKNGNKLTIAAIGDIHAHKNVAGAFRDLFKKINEEADVLLLCGDLTNFGTVEEAEVLADDFRDFSIPILAVLGNHDYDSGQVPALREVLKKVKFQFLEEEPFEMGKVGFAGAKGFGGGFDQTVVAGFGEDAMKAFVREGVEECLKLENQLSTLQAEHKIVALHYAPIAGTLEGEPLQLHPFLGTSRLAESIDRFDVQAVFHGHAHHGKLEGATPKGALVVNCAQAILRQNGLEYYSFQL